MIKLRFIFICFLTLSVLIQVVDGQTKPSTADKVDWVTLNDKDASDVANNAVSDYKSIERILVSELDSGKIPPNREVLIIYILGQIHSRWAITTLIRMIDFRAPFGDPNRASPRWGEHPAHDALVQIGSASVEKIVDDLKVEGNMIRVKLLVSAIHEIDGDNPGRTCLGDALAVETAEPAKKNLQSAIAVYDQLIKDEDK